MSNLAMFVDLEELRCQPGENLLPEAARQQTKIDLEQEHAIGDPLV
jgi:hypothetical protein